MTTQTRVYRKVQILVEENNFEPEQLTRGNTLAYEDVFYKVEFHISNHMKNGAVSIIQLHQECN